MLTWLKSLFTPAPEVADHVVICNPSLFRGAEDFVAGPLPEHKAKAFARQFVEGERYGKATVVLANRQVFRGARQVWPPLPGATTLSTDYRYGTTTLYF